MKQSKLVFFFTAYFSMLGTNVSAYFDISVVNDDSVTIYYQWNHNKTELYVANTSTWSPENSYSGNIVIPQTVEYHGQTYPVTGISEKAFYKCKDLKSVTIPNGVVSIWGEAFAGCNALTSVIVPNSMTYIASNAFDFCNALESIIIPSSVTITGEYGFSTCTNLVVKVKILDLPAFCQNQLLKKICAPIILIDEDLNEIKELIIPESVTIIESQAFKNCSGLTNISIPNTVTYISSSAFAGCTSLTSLTIPSSVTSIGDYAFSDCSGLESIIMQNSLEYTNKNIFNKCDNIREVTFDCEYIHSIFSDCLSLEKVIITDKAIAIDTQAFQNCSGLKTIDISNSVTSIGRNAFRSCTSLTSVTLPNSVTSIGDYAFKGCTGLKFVNCLCDPTSIGDDVFSRCSNIKEVTFDCEFVKSLFCNISSINKINLTDKVTSIGDRAFYGCSGLTSINIPNSVTSIGNSSFSGCSSLTSVTIPNRVTSIGDYAFYGCSGLESVTIPNSVTSIGEKAFSQSNIPVIISLISEPFPIYFTFSSNTFKNAILYVPKGTIKKYKSTNGWSSFANIKEFDGETGIKSITSDSEVYEVYTLDGNRIQHPSKGIHIIKMKDGTVKKGFVK